MIGGRNLLPNTLFAGSLGDGRTEGWTYSNHGTDYDKGELVASPFDPSKLAMHIKANNARYYIQQDYFIPVNAGEKITISVNATSKDLQIWWEFNENPNRDTYVERDVNFKFSKRIGDRLYETFTVPEGAKYFYLFRIGIGVSGSSSGEVIFEGIKLEKGNKATDWSPAPEDVFNDASYHRMGIYENGNIEDPEELLWATWNELQEQKRPFENYELDVLLYAEKAGLDHEKVRLGDTSIALDRRFARPIEVEERIIAYEYDVANPDDTGKVELGQFRELFSDEKRLDKIQAQLDNAQGKANHPEIDDSTFPDIKPETPTNFTADGLFKVIQLKWDFVASSYIAAYELYASQIPNFIPTPETLVWRGKTGGYAFEADTDEQWYFRLRAINTHGTSSDFTNEISAQTIKINAGIDVAPYTITDQLIAQNANIDGAKIGDATITSAKISNLIGDLITAGIIKDANDRVLFNLDDGILNINDGAINIKRPDGAIWMVDGLEKRHFAVTGAEPHRMDEKTGPSGWHPAFEDYLSGAGSYYSADVEELDGTEQYSEDIRDSSKGYTINFQRYYFLHSSRYFVIRFQPSTRTTGLERMRTRVYDGSQQLFSRDFEESEYGTFYRLIVDMGKPDFEEKKYDLRIGFLRQWKKSGSPPLMAFRISRTYLTDDP